MDGPLPDFRVLTYLYIIQRPTVVVSVVHTSHLLAYIHVPTVTVMSALTAASQVSSVTSVFLTRLITVSKHVSCSVSSHTHKPDINYIVLYKHLFCLTVWSCRKPGQEYQYYVIYNTQRPLPRAPATLTLLSVTVCYRPVCASWAGIT